VFRARDVLGPPAHTMHWRARAMTRHYDRRTVEAFFSPRGPREVLGVCDGACDSAMRVGQGGGSVALGWVIDREGLSPRTRIRKADGQEDFQPGGNVWIDGALAGEPAAHGVSMFACMPCQLAFGSAEHEQI
jgi:hypothetical protein